MSRSPFITFQYVIFVTFNMSEHCSAYKLQHDPSSEVKYAATPPVQRKSVKCTQSGSRLRTWQVRKTGHERPSDRVNGETGRKESKVWRRRKQWTCFKLNDFLREISHSWGFLAHPVSQHVSLGQNAWHQNGMTRHFSTTVSLTLFFLLY